MQDRIVLSMYRRRACPAERFARFTMLDGGIHGTYGPVRCIGQQHRSSMYINVLPRPMCWATRCAIRYRPFNMLDMCWNPCETFCMTPDRPELASRDYSLGITKVVTKKKKMHTLYQ